MEASEIKINGGTFCLDKSKQTDSKISDIGSGASGEETGGYHQWWNVLYGKTMEAL